MRLGALILLLHLGMGGVLLAAALGTEPPNAAGGPHPRFEGLQVGGAGAARSAPVWGLGWALGSLNAAFFAASFALGLRRGPGGVPFPRALLAGALGHQVCWALLVWLAWRFAHDPAASPLVLGFPLPTAFMLYGFGAFPLFFLALYLWHFERAVWSERDQRHFDLALRAARDEADPGR